MTVKAVEINSGTPSKFFILVNICGNQVLHYVPNKWRTEKGALNWAAKHGYDIQEG